MNHLQASDLIKCLKDLNEPINRATELTLALSEIEEQRQVRGHLSRVLSELYSLIGLIARQHPDLDPLKDES